MSLGIVFDLDDTLYAERDFALSAFRAAARWAESELALNNLDHDLTRLLDQGLLGKVFGRALAERKPDHTEAHLATLIAHYRDRAPERLDLHEDARWALTHYAARAPLALITDGRVESQTRKVAALGIADRFAHVVITDALGEPEFRKPHPRAYEVVEAALAGAASRYVYIGDNPAKDFVTPNARGWMSIHIDRPGRLHAAARHHPEGAPHHVIRSLRELPELLGV